MKGKNTNYWLAIILFILSIYFFYTKYYLNSAGWLLLGLTLILINYLSKISAGKKYYLMALSLPILALICFVLEFFY